MKKNTGLKVLTGAVIAVTVLIIINGKHHATDITKLPSDSNNLNEAIASQFNDNIRDVAARLQETEKKLATLESEKSSSPNNSAFIKEINKLKEELDLLKNHRGDTSYPVSEKSASPAKEDAIKDIDLLLMKEENNSIESNYWAKLKEKQKEQKVAA